MKVLPYNPLDGNGDSRRGPLKPPVPYPPAPGDGDNVRAATRPEGIPAGMYLQVPPISWSDSGVPGLFVRDMSPMYKLNPMRVDEVEFRIRVSTEESVVMPIPEVTGKLRFNRRQVIEGFKVSGPTPLNMDAFGSASLVYLDCVEGSGSFKFNGGIPDPIEKSGKRAFFNYSGGIHSVEFNGDLVVDILLFQ